MFARSAIPTLSTYVAAAGIILGIICFVGLLALAETEHPKRAVYVMIAMFVFALLFLFVHYQASWIDYNRSH